VRFLFVHQNFPGQYLHIIRHLLTDPANEVVFISEPNEAHIPGVRRVSYDMNRAARPELHPNASDYERCAMRAEKVAAVARTVRQLGFTPDIIIGHHGWGELLNLQDVWPHAPILGYFEYYYHTTGSDVDFDPEFTVAERSHAAIRAMNIVNHLALSMDQHGQTPTRFQRDVYPPWARPQIRLLAECADLETCRPDPTAGSRDFTIGDFTVRPGDRLITYVARNLEPYRGVHVMLRALPAIMAARPDVKVVMVGGDEVSYGARIVNTTWRELFLRQLEGQIDHARLLMPGQVKYDVYRRLLQRSDAHVYLTYPFVASWSLREALATGCAVIGADVAPVREFITHGRNGLLTPALDPNQLAQQVLNLLEDPTLGKQLSRGARRYAESHLAMAQHIHAFEARIAQIVGGG
jgi:glycosyltransferase involved in cell wall biosynthesis